MDPCDLPPAGTTVADVFAAAKPGKRKRLGNNGAPLLASPSVAAPSVASPLVASPSVATLLPAQPSVGAASAQPKSSKVKQKSQAVKPAKVKQVAHRSGQPPRIDEPSSFNPRAATESFVSMLNESEVDLETAQLPASDEEEAGEAEEAELEEIEEEVFDQATNSKKKKKRAVNYTEVEDVCLVKAWSQVSVDAITGTDQTGKRYWQRIEDRFFQLMPRVAQPVSRSFRSLQGRWDVIKPACSRWAACLAQVRNAPPSGVNVDEYETYAGEKYKQMKGSFGKPFTLQHCYKLLEHMPKWTNRDLEVVAKKDGMKSMDDGTDDEGERNKNKPEGNKKTKERLKMEGEASSLRDKIEAMVKSKEQLTAKTLEVKMLMQDKKMSMKHARWEAIRHDVKLKCELEERRLKIKETKAAKELLAEEKEIMLMDTSKMTPVQLELHELMLTDILERRKQARQGGSATSARADSSMSADGAHDADIPVDKMV